MTTGSVVPKTMAVTDAEFRAAMLQGLARCDKAVGEKALAFTMDLTTKQLGNIVGKGSTPGPKRLWDALAACPTALDDVAALYGLRLVPKDAVCDMDDAGVALARLLQRVLEAEHPESPGGRKIVPQELLPMEPVIRAVHAKTGKMISMCNDIRRPREVA